MSEITDYDLLVAFYKTGMIDKEAMDEEDLILGLSGVDEDALERKERRDKIIETLEKDTGVNDDEE